MDWSRRDILKLVPASLGAGALVTLPAGCGQSNWPVVKVVNGQAVLDFKQFPELAQAGGGVVVITDSGLYVAVMRASPTQATAFDGRCTHEGCAVSWDTGKKDLYCGCHGSTFSTAGAPTGGPAGAPLSPSYPATISAAGDRISVKVV